jgi:hypothetical protein
MSLNRYLTDLLTVVRIDYPPLVGPSIEHFEVSPVLVDGFPLRAFASRQKVRLADPVKECHDQAFVAVSFEDRLLPTPVFLLMAESANSQ